MTEETLTNETCDRCGGVGGAFTFKSSGRTIRACWACLITVVKDAKAAGIDYKVE